MVHSLRVAFRLLGMGFASEVVVAGVLHDILEKCAISPAQLIRRFGLDVGLIVQATTNNLHLRDPLERYADSVSRCAAYGEGALLVRAADLLDNCDRTLSLGGMARLSRLAEKLRLLTAVCRDEDIDAAMIDELQRCLRRINRRLAGLSIVDKPDGSNKAGRAAGRKDS